MREAAFAGPSAAERLLIVATPSKNRDALSARVFSLLSATATHHPIMLDDRHERAAGRPDHMRCR